MATCKKQRCQVEGCIRIGDREILIYRIHDLDYFHLEYVELNKDVYMIEMPESHYIDDVKNVAESMMHSRIVSISNDPETYNLKNQAKHTNIVL